MTELHESDFELIQNLIEKGESAEFSNGCYLGVMDRKTFEGNCPYGTVWMCNNDNNTEAVIINWLKHWNKPRDEWGDLIN